MKSLKLIHILGFCLALNACIEGPKTITRELASISDPDTTAPETNVINVKNKGAKADGVTDDLAAFQAAVAEVPAGGTVFVPAGTYLVDVSETKSIKLKSNMHFMLDENAIIKAKPNNLTRYYVINIAGVDNVEVSGGKLVGERDQHVGTTGEWGYGIRVGEGSTKINIHDIHISKFWGDGVCIGGYSKDVELRRVVATQNRRQGLSITRSENIRVYDSEFSYTEGTLPQYGIDIEPDPHPDGFYARNILIQGCKIHNNKGGGISVYKQTYDIKIVDNEITYNPYGIYTVESFDSVITGNLFAHHGYQGVAIRGRSENYEVVDNIFRNNHTVVKGLNTVEKPLVEMVGFVSGSGGNGSHIQKSTDTVDIRVLRNYYAD